MLRLSLSRWAILICFRWKQTCVLTFQVEILSPITHFYWPLSSPSAIQQVPLIRVYSNLPLCRAPSRRQVETRIALLKSLFLQSVERPSAEPPLQWNTIRSLSLSQKESISTHFAYSLLKAWNWSEKHRASRRPQHANAIIVNCD